MSIIINALFTLVMVLLAYIDVTSYKKGEHKDLKSPILSLGILGTFLGIFLGLIGFDTSNIQESVPKLLDGLKIAFFTSIAGMGVAISLYIYQRFNPPRGRDDLSELEYIKEKVSKLDQLDQLEALNYLEMLKALHHQKSIDTTSKESLNELKKISKNIERFHSSIYDLLVASFEQILFSLKKATEEIAKGASTEIINALESVIKDFNQNLNEQFGDNFKELNEGMHNLIAWQNGYKSSIESTEKSLRLCVDSISSSKDTLEFISSKNDEIMGVYRELSFIINTYANQIKTLNGLLSEFATLGERSRGSLENIENMFNLSKERFSELLKEFFDSITDTKDRISKKIEEIYLKSYKSNEDLSQKLTLLFEESCKNLDALSQEISKSLTDMVQEFINHSTQSSNAGVTIIDTLSQEVKNRITTTFEELNNNTSEINKRLLALSEDFTKESSKKIEEVQKEILSNSQDFFDSILKGSTKQIEALSSAVSNLQEYALNSINEVKTHNLESSNSFFESIRESTKKHITDVSLSTIELSELAKLTINELKEHSIKSSKDFYEAGVSLTESAKEGVAELKSYTLSSLNSFYTTTQEGVKQYLDFLSSSQKESLNSNLIALRESIESISKESLELITNSNKEALKEHNLMVESFLSTIDSTIKKGIADSSEFIKKSIEESQKLYEEASQNIKALIQSIEMLSKESIEQGNLSQKAIEKSFAMSAKAHKELKEKNIQLLESIDIDLKNLIKTQRDSFSQTMEHYESFTKQTKKAIDELLASIDSFNTEFTLNSSESLKNMTKEIKESAQSLQDSIESLTKKSVNSIGNLLRQATNDYLSTLETTANEGKDIPLKIAQNIKNSFLLAQKELAEYSKSTNSSIYNTKNILEELAKQTNANLSTQIEESRALNEELQRSLRVLDNSMHAVITAFKNDYDWLLRRIRELMGTERL